MGFGSQSLQEAPGALMGTVQGPATPMGDTLPYALAGSVPTATGSGWAMQLPPVFSVGVLGTLPTGTTTLNWAQYNFFTWTSYGGAYTLAFTNMVVGQQIQVFITGAASGVATWPSGITWQGLLTSTSGASAAAPAVGTGLTLLVTITCIALGTSPAYVGSYITN